MEANAPLLATFRERIIAEPEVILEDRDVMRALIAANEAALGDNIIDLRGVAMQRMEARLDRLEDTHRSVIAAAYENLAGTEQVHRAILTLLEPASFTDFMQALAGEVSDILRLDSVRLVLEAKEDNGAGDLSAVRHVLHTAPVGFVDAYFERSETAPARTVVLRPARPQSRHVHDGPNKIKSEALLRLDFGPGKLPGMLVLGSSDGMAFAPSMGTDLLAHFAGVFERLMRRWLA